jgi:hypothetical protein
MSMSPLQATFEAARHFGLTDDEAWHTLEASLYDACDEDTMSELHDELVAALAARILAKQRASVPSRTAGTAKAR